MVLIGGGVLVLALALVAFLVFRSPEEASAPIEAIPLAQPTAASALTAAPTDVALTAPTAAPTAAAAAPTSAPAAAAPQVFQIVSAQSEARFLIDEVLRGSPVTVVGATNQVAGQIAVDPTNPQSTQLGPIQINARTLATDNDFRNRAIKNVILRTDDYEFVTFTPTGISGMPEAVSVGQPFSFQVNGDLTIADVTRPVTFDVTVTPTSDTQIEGTASTTIAYRDFELTIPDSPAVDTVADQVRLELQFIAEPVA
jgi:polyisoprenoid-binding protein YceI